MLKLNFIGYDSGVKSLHQGMLADTSFQRFAFLKPPNQWNMSHAECVKTRIGSSFFIALRIWNIEPTIPLRLRYHHRFSLVFLRKSSVNVFILWGLSTQRQWPVVLVLIRLPLKKRRIRKKTYFSEQRMHKSCPGSTTLLKLVVERKQFSMFLTLTNAFV